MISFLRFIANCFLIILTFGISQATATPDLSQSSITKHSVMPLTGNWRFAYGDQQAWSAPAYDDSHWPVIKVPGLIKQLHETPIIGWYRLHFDLSEQSSSQQALLIEYIRHADETWLNGVKIGGEGRFDAPWHFMATNPQGLARFYPIPEGLLKTADNVLAIKVGIGFGAAWGAMFPGGAGILRGSVYLGDEKPLQHRWQKSLITTSSLDMLFIAFGVIDLLIILFLLKGSLHRFPEFPWLLLTSIFMMLGALGQDFYYLQGFHFIRLNLVLMIALLGIPLSISLYFWSQYRHFSTRMVTSVVACWFIISLIFFIPGIPDSVKIINWYLWNLLAAVFFLYAFYCATLGLLQRRTGALLQFLALLGFAISIRTQWLPDQFFGHRNIQIGSLFYRYALLFAYFQHIKQMQLDYKKLSQRIVKVADDIYANLARELHDGIGQHLASLRLQTQLAKSQLSGNNTHLDNMEQELKTATTGLRRILAGLHPLLIDKHSLTGALRQETEHLNSLYSPQITLSAEEVTLNKETEHQLFRIFQEAVNNVLKHAQASHIHAQLEANGNQLQLRIEDDGKGFAMQKDYVHQTESLGLVSLFERVQLLNGHIHIDSHQETGTCISVVIPL